MSWNLIFIVTPSPLLSLGSLSSLSFFGAGACNITSLGLTVSSRFWALRGLCEEPVLCVVRCEQRGEGAGDSGDDAGGSEERSREGEGVVGGESMPCIDTPSWV